MGERKYHHETRDTLSLDALFVVPDLFFAVLLADEIAHTDCERCSDTDKNSAHLHIVACITSHTSEKGSCVVRVFVHDVCRLVCSLR